MKFDEAAIGTAIEAMNFGAGLEQAIEIYLKATNSVIVPREPNEAVFDAYRKYHPLPRTTYGEASRETYRAMTNAAQEAE